MTHWAIITGAYAENSGGVSDYTRLVARGLAAVGDSVIVYAPETNALAFDDPGVVVRRIPDHFGSRGLHALSRLLRTPRCPDRVLIQYVPYGYGWKGMNVPFCWWVYKRAMMGDHIELVVHEAFIVFGRKPKYWVVAIAQRIMAWLLLHAAQRVWYSIPNWEEILRPFAPRGVEFRHLPMPSNVPPQGDEKFNGLRPHAVGCFSSFSNSMTHSLAAVLERLLPRITGTVLLIGLQSEAFRDQFVASHPDLAARLIATGPVELAEVPAQLNSCEVMLQPVAGGISGRNTATLACLQQGRPTVSTVGHLTESFWIPSGALLLSRDGDSGEIADQVERLLSDEHLRQKLAQAGRNFYDCVFDSRHTIETLSRRGTRVPSAQNKLD